MLDTLTSFACCVGYFADFMMGGPGIGFMCQMMELVVKNGWHIIFYPLWYISGFISFDRIRENIYFCTHKSKFFPFILYPPRPKCFVLQLPDLSGLFQFAWPGVSIPNSWPDRPFAYQLIGPPVALWWRECAMTAQCPVCLFGCWRVSVVPRPARCAGIFKSIQDYCKFKEYADLY